VDDILTDPEPLTKPATATAPAPTAAANALTDSQWALIERLGTSLAPEQAQWLSGYFAGLAAAAAGVATRAARRSGASAAPAPIVSATAPPAARAFAPRGVTILYGSETGNSARIAQRLAKAAETAGIAATLADMRDYRTRLLKDERTLLIVTATHGEGDPPQTARGFFEFVEGRKAPRLEGLRYAVLALGDESYEHFCAAGRRLDERLAALGAQRLQPRVECDIDYEAAVQRWSRDIVNALVAQSEATPAPAPAATLQLDSDIRVPEGWGRSRPFPATVIENLVLAGRGSTKETRHVELSLAGSGLAYEPGDALGIVARNDPAVVAALLGALQLPAGTRVTVDGAPTTLADALTGSFEITLATPRFLDHWNALAGKRAPFASLGGDERSALLRSHHIVDIVRRFPLPGVDAQRFVDGLRPLQPRLYSIASSHAASPDEVHLTVAPVRYMMQGERRSGVVSGALADRVDVDAALPVYVHRNPHFRLPGDQRPIVMIGAGTGVAPYRAFLQEREMRGGGGPAWLFFGERNFRSDFLYQLEWQGWLRDGLLSRMDVAFSRDRAHKRYVQHRLRERGADVYRWLEDGANLYVCGDAARLAPDVHEALLDVVAQHAGVDRDAAGEYLGALARDGRYQRDVY
jgi:sulfite reductase (NADPH) flavoprotein alpha-component